MGFSSVPIFSHGQSGQAPGGNDAALRMGPRRHPVSYVVTPPHTAEADEEKLLLYLPATALPPLPALSVALRTIIGLVECMTTTGTRANPPADAFTNTHSKSAIIASIFFILIPF